MKKDKEIKRHKYTNDMGNLITLFKNFRPYRSVHYSGLVIGGALIACWQSGQVDYILHYGLRTISLAAAIILAFQSACVLNDFYDVEGDKSTNPARPLSSNSVSEGLYRRWGYLCFAASLLLSALAGLFPLVMIIMFQILYTVYSMPPLRLKRIFPINTAIIAVNGLIAMAAGFGIIAGFETFYFLPSRLALTIGVVFITSINMIYIKDRKSDMLAGIKSIPTMMSERASRRVIALLTVAAYFSVPLILGISSLYIFSFIGAAFGAYWVLRKKWNEGPYFITYFIYYVIMIYYIRVEGIANI